MAPATRVAAQRREAGIEQSGNSWTLEVEETFQGLVLLFPLVEIEGAHVARRGVILEGLVLDDPGEIFRGLLGANPPHDVAAPVRLPVLASLGEPGCKPSIGMKVGANPEGLEIPAILPGVLQTKFSPEVVTSF